uniref:B-block binding subunit of TFIIIC domain-containing protein n=1 Tax=Pygocentrus nattereri TaxID=42514 RepID=A0A3B4EAN5_PYGNA
QRKEGHHSPDKNQQSICLCLFRWYGEKLVLVASQELRYRALIGDEGNPELKLSDYSYCILERLGRARWQGEIQRDLHISSFKLDAGKVHYLRKSLDRNGLITLQSHVVRLPTGVRQHSILLLLKRFHVDRRSKYDILMESTSNLLSELPNNIGIMLRLREQLQVGEHTFKRVYQYMQAAKMVSVLTIPLQELNPEAGPCKTKRGTDIRVRCLKLLRPYTRKETYDDDDDENNDEDADGLVKRNIQAQARDIERDLLTQAYEIVVANGPKGISQSVLRGQLNIGRLESRMVCKVLERNNMIKGFMEDEGRQRTTKYISKLFVEKSNLNLRFAKELERSEKLRVPKNDSTDPGNGPCPDPEDQEDALRNDPETEQDPQEEEEEEAHKGQRSKGKAGKKSKSAKKGSQRAVPSTPRHSTPQSETADDTVTVVEEVVDEKRGHEQHETYRMLKRKNLIIEAVRNLKVIEGLYTLQKKLMDEEKQDGVSTKVCKKSIVRLTRSLSRDGYLKLFRTTVIQDGVSRKVEFVVHPSVTPDDPLVKSAIEQVRFKISSSYTEEEKAKAVAQDSKDDLQSESKSHRGKTERQMDVKELKDFKPTIVPGLSRSLGFQPKMPRFRMVHSFLFYLMYDHPFRQTTFNDPSLTADPTDEQFKVYVNELSWKRFVPPLPVHREFGYGWALTSDVLISLPLSVYVQVIQINYKVDGLEEFLNDPVKQHYLIRFLPSNIKTQLLHRRKYFFSFYENLQKLCYMGLLQFGPMEKFMDKDQGFFYLKKRATIVDTTTCEPHYNLAIEMRPFDRRHYTFTTAQDVENYWFDMLCVCLNTPLGVVRPRSRLSDGDGDREGDEPDVAVGAERYERLQYTLKGSCDVVDDGVTPGDGQGAGGLDSSFFSHLKRNWLWTTHLVSKPKKVTWRQSHCASKEPAVQTPPPQICVCRSVHCSLFSLLIKVFIYLY